MVVIAGIICAKKSQLLKSQEPALQEWRAKQICQLSKDSLAVLTNAKMNSYAEERFYDVCFNKEAPWHSAARCTFPIAHVNNSQAKAYMRYKVSISIALEIPLYYPATDLMSIETGNKKLNFIQNVVISKLSGTVIQAGLKICPAL